MKHMPYILWNNWMDEHHIKLRGDPCESRSDAVHSGGDISRDKVALESNADARSPGNSHIQKPKRKR